MSPITSVKSFVRIVFALFCIFIFAFPGHADDQAPAISKALRSPMKDQPALPEYLPKKSDGNFILPPAPKGPDAMAGAPMFELKDVVFEGNTVFGDQDLEVIATPFIDRMVSLGDLEELRYLLTRHYVDAGYINSGALLKADQQVKDGIVQYFIVEGKLQKINIYGNERLSDRYVKFRLWPDKSQPFNTNRLQERFLLLLQDPLIRKMNGSIQPGADPGKAFLELGVTRARPYGASLIVDNHTPPSTGSLKGTVSVWVRNLNGYGDFLNVSGGKSEGADSVHGVYTALLNRHNTKLSIGYDFSENAVVEEPLRSIDIESESDSLDISLSHPFYQALQNRFELGLGFSKRQSKTRLLGQPFSFSEGDEDGKSRVSAIRLVQSFTYRTVRHALALRSTFSFGLGVFDATTHPENRPDGRFVSWLGQFQYAHRLGERFGSLILRGDMQFSDEKLLNLERFALGGASTVRGYRENEFVRDNGYDVSIEWRYPLWRVDSGKNAGTVLHLACFSDFGAAWNKGDGHWENRLHSIGTGLLFEGEWVNAQVYIAHDIEEASAKDDYDLQDDGIHFQLAFNY